HPKVPLVRSPSCGQASHVATVSGVPQSLLIEHARPIRVASPAVQIFPDEQTPAAESQSVLTAQAVPILVGSPAVQVRVPPSQTPASKQSAFTLQAWFSLSEPPAVQPCPHLIVAGGLAHAPAVQAPWSAKNFQPVVQSACDTPLRGDPHLQSS